MHSGVPEGEGVGGREERFPSSLQASLAVQGALLLGGAQVCD